MDRLLRYWKVRRTVFEDRFALPMNLTGQGAMCPDDIEALDRLGVIPLPSDAGGRLVLYYNRSRFYTARGRRDYAVRRLFVTHIEKGACLTTELSSLQLSIMLYVLTVNAIRDATFSQRGWVALINESVCWAPS